jgi:hypothetical protein
MSWLFSPKHATPKIAYLALCLAVLAFFAPGIYFAAMDDHLPQRAVALKGFLLGMILSFVSFALSIAAIFYYRKKENNEGTKFARAMIVVSSLILIIHFCIFTIFLTT